MKSKFKVGDKVVVRADIQVGGGYKMENDTSGSTVQTFVDSMEKFKGKEVTIKFASGAWYSIQEDEGIWYWTDEMFEGLAVKPIPEKHVIQEFAKMGIFVEQVIFHEPATIMFYRAPKYNRLTGEFEYWGDTKKVVAKCNTIEGDAYDKQKGVEVCLLKAFRKEADRLLAKM
jgi:hypothetical protein